MIVIILLLLFSISLVPENIGFNFAFELRAFVFAVGVAALICFLIVRSGVQECWNDEKLENHSGIRGALTRGQKVGNVFYDCIDFLNEYPTMPLNDLRTAVQLLKKSIDINNPKQVKKYYDTINRVAFALPNSEESLKFVSEIIDERKKVEIMFEDIKD